jgi:hypothetical protein
MVKTKTLVIRVSEKQHEELEQRAKSAHFASKSSYVRCFLFKPELLGGKQHE